MAAKLKNYTTTVPAEKSIAEIEQLLVDFGADNFMKKVDSERRQFSGIMFTFIVNGKSIPFKLPANVEKVREYIWNEYDSTRTRGKKQKDDFDREAYNVAWRLIKDWVHDQLSIIATDMVKMEEVFLPYIMIDDNTTVSDKFLTGDWNKMLPEWKG